MEVFVVLLGVGYFLVLPVLALTAWFRTSSHSRQIEELRYALQQAAAHNARLDAELARMQGGAPAASDAIAPQQTAAQAIKKPAASITVAAPVEIASPPPLPAEPVAVKESVPADTATAQPASQTPAPQAIGAAPRPERTLAAAKEWLYAGDPAGVRDVPAGPDFAERAFAAAKDWLLGGNSLVRIGMLLVFLGLAFLLRYTSEHIVIRVEARYLGVALTALVALALGWRLRAKRRAYGLLMQGGAVGVMYLTVFAALKLHGLLSSETGFALMVAIVAFSCALAVVQDALPLAMAAALGGFATPVLISTGGGSHVALFTYFALLNAGILGIAWFKAWRPLNLVGFFGTFLIGMAWGLRSYHPLLHYASTQPFLILFFLMFVCIGLLFARRMLLDDPDAPTTHDAAAWVAWLAKRGHTAQHYVDGTLLFGTPIVGFGLQYGLVYHMEYGAAFSALALGVFYLALAKLTHAANPLRHRLLTEIFLALGVIFASLAIPLALDAQWTTAAWALEAAGIYWVGHRQQRPLARGFAVLLQAGATIAFVQRLGAGDDTVLSGSALGALLLALSFLSNMGVLRRHAEGESWDRDLEPIFGSLGLWSLYLIAPLLLSAEHTAAAWALGGMTTIFAGLRLKARGWVTNAMVVQLFAGFALLKGLKGSLFVMAYLPPAQDVTPFSHAGFWTPVIMALAAFAAAWRLHAYARSPAAEDADGLRIDGAWPSFAALAWSTVWWAFAWWMELMRIETSTSQLSHHFLMVMAASTLALLPIAAKLRWAALAGISSLLLPLIALVAAGSYAADVNLLGADGWAAYALALMATFRLLRISAGLLVARGETLLHLVNTWVWLGVAALQMRYVFLALGEPGSTWRWLGWVLPLAAWLLWQARKAPPRLWPASAHPRLYRIDATAPLLAILLAWLVLANLYVNGDAAPLPFIPLLNPLDLALMLVLYGGWQWHGQLRAHEAMQLLHVPFRNALLAGAFLTYTCAVLRGAHHLADVPWQFEELMHSMLVQASLSLAWALLALGLMIAGHRTARRAVWIAGAALVAVVVAKLFLIELSDRGGLERIVSFLGVGVALLVVGYYAPLPPNREKTRDGEPANAAA